MERPYDNWVFYLNETLQIPDEQPYTALDLFAGAGGLSLGFECAGFRTVGYEMNPDCCETHNHNMHGICRQQFITPDASFPKTDVVIGGPPCQPFSRSGKQLGDSDGRNGFPSFISAIRRYRPEIWMCENVVGLPESMHDYYLGILEELSGLGYEVEAHKVKMVKYDVPQKRERLVIVGHRGGYHFPKEQDYAPVTVGDAIGDIVGNLPEHPKWLTKSQDEYIARYEAKSHCVVPRDLHFDKPARTLTCRNLAGATSDMQRVRHTDGRRRRIEVREAARLQSFPDWFEFCGNEQSQYQQIGNAVPPLFSYKLAVSFRNYLEERRERKNIMLDGGCAQHS